MVMNWFSAMIYCRNYDSDLAVIESEAELNALSFYLITNEGHVGLYFWLGVTDLAEEVFHWFTVCRIHLQVFRIRKEIRVTMALAQYILILCFTGVLCNTANTSAPSADCSTDTHPFMPIGSKYYLINAAVKMNWFEADLFCRTFDSDLAIIESEAEMDALAFHVTTNGNLGKYFWLGTTDLAVEGKFMSHYNGRAMPYAKWSRGQPDDNQKREDCVHLWPVNNIYFMNDYPCYSEGYALCEMRRRPKCCGESALSNCGLKKLIQEYVRSAYPILNCRD
ncbi:C-type lectin BML-2-like isoform X1 [Bactrocera tryoni]|uniref:C-type lectin BML-2-like isoform X1 n=2 Tax=Bactrocera tryoni TaxID=59916 RepID=UPI001A960C9A|nr:C-type lectin BML-2-like isoform X1 [Bactrocera tryoni]